MQNGKDSSRKKAKASGTITDGSVSYVLKYMTSLNGRSLKLSPMGFWPSGNSRISAKITHEASKNSSARWKG
jgi:hypothetical protein